MLEVQSSRHANDDIGFVEVFHGVTPFLSCKTFVSYVTLQDKMCALSESARVFRQYGHFTLYPHVS